MSPLRCQHRAFPLVFLLLTFAWTMGAIESTGPRQELPLNGSWQFQRDKTAADQWKTVAVPSSLQDHEGTEFHGIGWYRKRVEPFSLPPGSRALLHFQAAATEVEVWWNGERLGSHLGGWTPFRFDITELVRKAPAEQAHELRVRLDEKVGHNTQGFLPIIAPHFGGLWQGVSVHIVPETYYDDLRMMAIGDPATGEIRLEVPITGLLSDIATNTTVRCRLRGNEQWLDLQSTARWSNGTLVLRARIPDARLWSPTQPNLYELEVAHPGAGGDRIRTRAAFRAIETFGPQFRLNGKPLQIRGLLNWGYSPPQVAPNPGEAAWRAELEFARAQGFNLMKFCLWLPPKRYLEMADEMGMLTWMEYPTWHPVFTEKFLEPLRREFHEFFEYDRNHPSVILRSLTCETGPSADLKVIRSLYDAAKEMIPGALVEDDSSWIGWNRVSDFWDDHPYGNNHDWVERLEGFQEHILGHGLKPLVLGESIAADTWLDREALLNRLGTERPWWAPGVLDELPRWEERMGNLSSPGGLKELKGDSLRYGMLMRKYQVEAFRRELPYAGYVISVIRDIPNATMGLLDYLGTPKWTDAEWGWQRDTICLLKTEADRRSFASGEHLKGAILLSHFGENPIAAGQLMVSLKSSGNLLRSSEVTNVHQKLGTLARALELDWPLPEVATPQRLVIQAELKTPGGEFRNEWPIWVVPAESPKLGDVQIHHSMASNLARELFPGCPSFNVQSSGKLVAASRFDDDLVAHLEGGGRVLLLPDGQRHSFARSAHWFLRGAPYIPDHALSRAIPRDLFVELQHFDLADDVVPDVPQLEAMDPILMLWDTHDLKSTVKNHGILFETRAGKGRILVSAARHVGDQNAAGRWLLGVLLEHLRSSEPPCHALPANVWDYLKARLHAEQTNLVSRTWKFRPDPTGEGLARNWHSPDLSSEPEWKDIQIGAWWESKGYPGLDGWAWYRLWVEVPQSWQNREVYLSFEGADDVYEVYVNGEPAGKGGDLATRKDALSEKKSHSITRFVKPGQKALIAVRVYDWYGAGGIFRPVTLGTLPFRPELDLLK